MNDDQPDPKETAAKFMAYLRRLRDDRGAMADLRCALIPARRARAWPLLASVGGIDRPVFETIAGLFAHHPEETHVGNLGTTCCHLAAKYSSFDGRFRRLISCDREEIGERLRPVILAAKARGIAVNYEELFVDLSYWGNSVKARWARECWGAPAGTEVSSPMEVAP